MAMTSTPVTVGSPVLTESSSHWMECNLEGHQEKLMRTLYCQWRDESFCDLQLCTSSGILCVHTCVIVAFSPRIAAVIKGFKLKGITSFKDEKESKDSAGYCIDVQFDYYIIKSIMEAIYSGVFSADVAGLDEISQALEWLAIEELVDIVKIFQEQLNGRKLSNINNIGYGVESKASNVRRANRRKERPEPKESKHYPPVQSHNLKRKSMNMVISLVNDVPCVVSVDSDDEECVLNVMNDDIVAERNNSVLQKAKKDDRSRLSDVQLQGTEHALERSDELIHFASDTDTEFNFNSNSESVVGTSDKDVTTSNCQQSIVVIAASDDTNKKLVDKDEGRRSRSLRREKKKARLVATKSRKGLKKSTRKSSSSKRSSCKEKEDSRDLLLPLNTSEDSGKWKDRAEILVHFGNKEAFEPTEVKKEIDDDEIAYLGLNSEPLSIHNCEDVDDVELFLSGGKDRVSCEKCKNVFTNVEDYQEHVRDHPTFTCEKCFSVYFSTRALCRHIRKAHFKSMHLKCSLCEFTAVDDSQFSDHCITVHQQIQPFKCQFEGCKFKTSKYRYLSRHFEKHENLRTFKCEKCERSFNSYPLLYSHKRSCYQVQKYLCDLCGQSFNHPTSMKIHRSTMHFGEKPHRCQVCVKSFSNSANLRRHMRIHNNAYPYSCSFCGQQFRHSNTLKLHMNKHNNSISISNGINLNKSTSDSDNVNVVSSIHSIDSQNKNNAANNFTTVNNLFLAEKPAMSTDILLSESIATRNIHLTTSLPLPPQVQPIMVATATTSSSYHAILNHAKDVATDNIDIISTNDNTDAPSSSTISLIYNPSTSSIAPTTHSVNADSLPIHNHTSQDNFHIIQRLLWNNSQDCRLHSY